MSTFKANTGVSIQRAFNKFHKQNPKVYKAFKKLAMQAIRKGRRQTSGKLIINIIRWHVHIETSVDGIDFRDLSIRGKKFKINDAYSSRYVRLFVKDHPKYAGRFNMRDLRSP